MSGPFPSYTCDEYNGCVPSLRNGQYQNQGQCMLNCPTDGVLATSNTIWRVTDFGLDNDPHSTRPIKILMSAQKALQAMNNAENVVRGSHASSTHTSYTKTFCGIDPMNTPWRGDARLNISLRPSPIN